MAHTTQKDKFGTDKGPNFGDAAKDIGRQSKQAFDKMSEGARDASEDAKGAVSTAVETAKGAATYVGDKAEQATEAVGSGIKSLAGTVRDTTPKEGMLHNAGEAVAGTLESSGRYLEEQGLSGIGEDLTNFIKRNPMMAVLAGIGIGFCLARMTRS